MSRPTGARASPTSTAPTATSVSVTRRGAEVAALPGVGAEARVVGFAGPAVFYTSNGSTFRWDTTTTRAAEWRQTEMVAFNDSTRTAVGQSATECFAVLRVDTPAAGDATPRLPGPGREGHHR